MARQHTSIAASPSDAVRRARKIGIEYIHALQDGADADTLRDLQAREARATLALPPVEQYVPRDVPVPVVKTRRTPTKAEEPEPEAPPTRARRKTTRVLTRRARRHHTPPTGDLLPLL